MVRKNLIIFSIFVMISFSAFAASSEEPCLIDVNQSSRSLKVVERNHTNTINKCIDVLNTPAKIILNILGYKMEWKSGGEWVQILADNQDKDNSEELLIFRENQQYGFIDSNGNIKIAAQFDVVRDFVDGIAVVGNHVDNFAELPSGTSTIQWGYINTNGERITPIMFSYAGDFSEGLALVQEDGSDSYYYIDKKGNRSSQKVIGPQFFTKGFAPIHLSGGASYPMPDSPPEVWSYIDSSGEIATDMRFEAAENFEEGYAVVKNNGKYGLIDTNFQIVIDYQYDGMHQVGLSLFAAKKGDKWGIIDVNENVILGFEYFNVGSFSDGLASVRSAINEGAYTDCSGKILYDSRFSMVYDFVDGYACVVDKLTGKAGVIDRNGQYVIDPTYYSLRPAKSGLFEARYQHGQDYFYINLSGEPIIPH